MDGDACTIQPRLYRLATFENINNGDVSHRIVRSTASLTTSSRLIPFLNGLVLGSVSPGFFWSSRSVQADARRTDGGRDMHRSGVTTQKEFSSLSQSR